MSLNRIMHIVWALVCSVYLVMTSVSFRGRCTRLQLDKVPELVLSAADLMLSLYMMKQLLLLRMNILPYMRFSADFGFLQVGITHVIFWLMKVAFSSSPAVDLLQVELVSLWVKLVYIGLVLFSHYEPYIANSIEERKELERTKVVEAVFSAPSVGTANSQGSTVTVSLE